MIKGLVMPTIRHTGSLFMCGVLDKYERVTLRGEAKEYSLVFDHVYDLHMSHFHRWIETFPTVVIPLRDPAKTAKSWVKRKESLAHFFTMWENIQEFEQYDPFYIPIDRPDKQDYLDALSHHLGISLKTDWKPVNTSKAVVTKMPDVSSLYEIPVIKELYT